MRIPVQMPTFRNRQLANAQRDGHKRVDATTLVRLAVSKLIAGSNASITHRFMRCQLINRITGAEKESPRVLGRAAKPSKGPAEESNSHNSWTESGHLVTARIIGSTNKNAARLSPGVSVTAATN